MTPQSLTDIDSLLAHLREGRAPCRHDVSVIDALKWLMWERVKWKETAETIQRKYQLATAHWPKLKGEDEQLGGASVRFHEPAEASTTSDIKLADAPNSQLSLASLVAKHCKEGA